MLLAAGLAGCEARISDSPAGDAGGLSGDAGAQLDAPADALVLGAWSTAVKVAVAATLEVEDDVTLSSNALEMVFAVLTETSGKDLYYTSRASPTGAWRTAILLPFVDETISEESPRFSADDRTLYFSSNRAGNGNLDIYKVTRPEVGRSQWNDDAAAINEVSTATMVEKWFMPCADNRYVLVQGPEGGETDLFEGRLGDGRAPAPLAVFNTADTETGVFLSRDCLTIYFASTRTDPEQIYTSRRESVTSAWPPPTVVTDFEGIGGDQEDPWLSPDGRTFAFVSNVSGTRDVYLSTR